jgi:hypothetical protein
VLGTRIWDSQHPSDIDKREVIDVIIPELDGLKIEYDTMNSKVTFWQKIVAFFRRIFG